jgi:hypothetical protein
MRHPTAAALLLVCACGGNSTPTSSTPTTTTPAAPPNLAGNWTLSITPSSICTGLPASVRNTRSYPVTITQSPTAVAMQFSPPVLTSTSDLSLRGSTLRLGIGISEPLGQTCFQFVTWNIALLVNADGTADARQSPIAGTLNGKIEYSACGPQEQSCTAADHRFTLTRR